MDFKLSYIVKAVKGEYLKERFKKWLMLLGGEEIRNAAVMPPEDDELSAEDDELSAEQIKIKLKETKKIRERSRSSWNKAFVYEISPYLIDLVNEKTGEPISYNGPDFYNTIKSLLAKRLGFILANEYVDMCASYILKHLDIFIRQAHGTGTRIFKEPLGILYLGKDVNWKILIEPDYEFIGQVMGKDPFRPYVYNVKVSGKGLIEEVYSLDTSSSLLKLYRNGMYKMKTRSLHGNKLYVLIPDADRSEALVEFLVVDDIFKLIRNGVKDFLDSPEFHKEYGDELGYKIKEIEENIEKLERRLEEVVDEAEREKIEDELDKLNKKLDEYRRKGIPEAGRAIKEPRVVHRLYKKMTKYPSLYEDWKYLSPVLEEQEVEFSQADIDKVERDLALALKEMHGMYKKVLPYGALAKMFMDAIYEVKDPSERGIQVNFIKKVQDYIKSHNLDIAFDDRSSSEVIKQIREVLLTDSRFRNLRNNLLRHVMKRVIPPVRRAFIERKDVVTILDEVWKHPEDTARLTVYYDHFNHMKKVKDLTIEEYHKEVEEGTINRFREYIADDKNLEGALKVLKALSGVLGTRAFLSGKLRRLFLIEVLNLWSPEDGIEAKGSFDRMVDLFNAYLKEFSSHDDFMNFDKRDAIYENIKKAIELGLGISKEPGIKEKEVSRRRRELKREIIHKPVDVMLRQREPELMKELETLFV